MAVTTWIVVGAVAFALIAVFYFIWKRNQFIRYENTIDNAWGQIDVQLQRRGELIPNLIETVKGYAAHEKAVFKAVSDARAAMVGAPTHEAKMEADNLLTAALGKIFAIAEAYPQLKADKNFLQLQDELSHTENKVAFARQHYNDAVLQYNNAIEQFPGSLVAGSRKERLMLQAPEASRAVPKVSF